MSQGNRIERVVEKHYSARELACLIGFTERHWRDLMKAGDLVLVDGASQVVIAQPVELSGEFFCPASCVNAYLARHPVRYDAGVKARNTAELRRRISSASRHPDGGESPQPSKSPPLEQVAA